MRCDLKVGGQNRLSGPGVAACPCTHSLSTPTHPTRLHHVPRCCRMPWTVPGLKQGSSHTHGTATMGRKSHLSRSPRRATPRTTEQSQNNSSGPQSGVRPRAFMQVRHLQHTATTDTFRSSQRHSAGRWHLPGVQQGSTAARQATRGAGQPCPRVARVGENTPLSHNGGPRTPQTLSPPTARGSPCRRGSHNSSRRSRSEPAHSQHQQRS